MKSLLATSLFALSVCASQGAVVFTNLGGDLDIFNDANWDFSGAVNATTSIAGNTTISEDLVITGFNVTGAAGSFGQLALGDGFSVTLTNGSMNLSGTTGFAGVDDGAGTARTNPPAVLSLVNSTATLQFASVGADILVDGTSGLTIRGGGDGINSQTEVTQVILSLGGTLTLPTLAEFTEQGGEILVGATTFTSDNGILSFSGNTGTAVPEPSAALLGGLGLLSLLLRRRK